MGSGQPVDADKSLRVLIVGADPLLEDDSRSFVCMVLDLKLRKMCGFTLLV